MNPGRWSEFASFLTSVAAYPQSQWKSTIRAKLPNASESLVDEAVGYLSTDSSLEDFDPIIPEPSPRICIGMVLKQRYEVIRSVGKGGLCEVYLAEDRDAGDRVAIKVLNDVYARDSYLLALLRRELRIGRALSHPNICRTFGIEDASLSDGTTVRFILMEFLDGETLGDLIARGPLDEALSTQIVEQVLDALEAAHKVSILHGDMKCSNVILIKRDGRYRAVVTDFGLARRLGPSQTQSLALKSHIMGTAAYMPPEQFQGKPLTPAADFHAVGVMMFRMVTGRFPFQGANWHESARLRVTQTAPSVRSINLAVSRSWATCVSRALETDPSDRPQTADEMRRLLRTGRGLKQTRRARLRIIRTAVPTVLVASALAGVSYYLEQNRPTTEKPEVVRHLKLGNEFLARRTPTDFQQALAEHQVATQLDPLSAAAWIGLAETYGGMSNWGVMPPLEVLPKGIAAASRALQLAPNHPRAHGIMGYLVSISVKDWLRAEPHFRRALELDKGDARIHFWFATHLGRLGRHADAIAHLKRAQQIEPQLLSVGHQLAFELERSGALNEFLGQSRELVRIQPLNGMAHITLARALIDNGLLDEAQLALDKAELYQAGIVNVLFEKAQLAAARKQPAVVLAFAEQLGKLAAKEPCDSSMVAGAYALAGKPDLAVRHLYDGLQRGDSSVLTAHVQTAFHAYRDNQEFRKFVAATGLRR